MQPPTDPADLPALGIDIGGTKVAGGVVAPDGTVLGGPDRAGEGQSLYATALEHAVDIAAAALPGWRATGMDKRANIMFNLRQIIVARRAELAAESPALCTIALESVDGATKLTVVHQSETPGSLLIGAVSDGWPKILSNLKSLLETGELVLASKP